MQSLAICNTPFQIFNIINALINQVEGLSNTDTDILIDMTFDSAKNTGVRIEELGLCRKVFYVKKKR